MTWPLVRRRVKLTWHDSSFVIDPNREYTGAATFIFLDYSISFNLIVDSNNNEVGHLAFLVIDLNVIPDNSIGVLYINARHVVTAKFAPIEFELIS